MNQSKIDLFPTSRTNTIEAGEAKVSINFDSYSQNISISSTDSANTINIRLDQEKMTRAFIYSLGNLRIKYDDAKRKFLKDVLVEATKQLVQATEEGTPERNQLESFLVDSFKSNKEVN